MVEKRIDRITVSVEEELNRLREVRPELNGRIDRAEHMLVSQLCVPTHVRPIKVRLSADGHTYTVRSGSKLSTVYAVDPVDWSCECRWTVSGYHARYGRACCHVLACWVLERVSRKAPAGGAGAGEQEQRAELPLECQNCGESNPRGEMVAVEDDEHLTWFGGEVLCAECARGTGVEIWGGGLMALPKGTPLFSLGRVVATPGALELLAAAGTDPVELLERHVSGNWGEVPPEDARENELSVREGFRIISSYPVGEDGSKVWLITEANRSSTCILKPEEY